MKGLRGVQRLWVGATIAMVAAGVLSSPAVAQIPNATYNGTFTSQTGIQNFYGGIDLQWGSKTALPPSAPISFTVSDDGSRISSVTIPSPIRGVYVGNGPGSPAFCEFFFYEPLSLNFTITNQTFSGSRYVDGRWVSFAGSFTSPQSAQGTGPENVPGEGRAPGLRVADKKLPETIDDPIGDDCSTGFVPWTASTAAQPPTPQAPSSDGGSTGRAIVNGVAPVKRGKALLKVRCPGATACKGVAKLWINRSKGRSKRKAKQSASSKRRGRLLIGKSRFAVGAGKSRIVRVRLNGKGKRLLRRARRHRLRAQLNGQNVKRRTVLLKQR